MNSTQSLTEVKKARIIRVFGPEGAKIILQRLDNLEETFGSSATVIRLVMEGKLTKTKVHDEVFSKKEMI
ncbi:MAG TPA: hypothetical protein VJN71_08060 [Nitrososphaerales archaeon]|nr:hypothetical protein [Nitrososphaerales archaeon]